MNLAQTLNLGSDNYISDAAHVFVQYLDNTSLIKLGMTCQDNYRIFDAYYVPTDADIIGSMRWHVCYNHVAKYVEDNINDRVHEILNRGSAARVLSMIVPGHKYIDPARIYRERIGNMCSLETAEILSKLPGVYRLLILRNQIMQ